MTLQISNLQIEELMHGPVDRKRIDKALDEISKSIIYLSDTIEDFKTYFHPDKEKTEVEVHSMLQKSINFILPRVKGTNIEVLFEPKEEIYIHTYVNELIQVILNLLNNAIDALSAANLATPTIEIKVEDRNENVCIDIIDNGKGIKEEHLSRIFEPYFSTKGKNGTGLGLYMSQMIIEKQFNGEIWVDSSVDTTRFCIEIPKT